MTDPRNFLLNTDNSVDKIIGINTGSITIGSYAYSETTVSHGFTFAPLPIVKWSYNSDFSTSYDDVERIVGADTTMLTASTDTSNTYVLVNNGKSFSQTLYYRIYYLIPSDINTSIPETQSVLDSYQFNTDFNYTKLFINGRANSSSATINHNLGYYPQVEVWYKSSFNNKIIHYLTSDVRTTTYNPKATLTTTQLILVPGSGAVANDWHYRIYIDES